MTHALAMHQNSGRRDPAGTRYRILAAAIEEFRCGGLAGARVDSIARRAQTNERMLYYYFGNKEQLFVAVVEDVYRKFADAQAALDLSHEAPERAMRQFVRFTWEYCYSHPEVVRVINNENLQEGVHLRTSGARTAMRPVIAALGALLTRGAATGDFRRDVDPLHCYLAIAGLGYYLVSNRFTLQAAFGRDLATAAEREQLLTLHLDMLMAYLQQHECAARATTEGGSHWEGDGSPPLRMPSALAGAARTDREAAREDAGDGAAGEAAAPSPSFFPGVARSGDDGKAHVGDGAGLADRSAVAPSGLSEVSRSSGTSEGSDAAEMARPVDAADPSAAATALSERRRAAGHPAAPRCTMDGTDADGGAHAAVFWPRSRFPSL